MSRDFGVNQGFVEELFLRWAANPSSVDPSWRSYFEALPPSEHPRLTSAGAIRAPSGAPAPTSEPPSGKGTGNGHARTGDTHTGHTHTGHTHTTPSPDAEPRQNGAASTNGNGYIALPPTAEMVPAPGPVRRSFPPSSDLLAAAEMQAQVSALVNAYRVRGHLYAALDPLGRWPDQPEEPLSQIYGLEGIDPDTVFYTGDMAAPDNLPLSDIVTRLEETYCRSIGVEFTFLENPEERLWLQQRMEESCNRLDLSREEQLRVLTKLTDAETFEQFLHTNYVGNKRFSLEGAESVIPMLDLLVDRSAELGVEEIVIGMAHRGRLNVLANIMNMNVREIFSIFEDVHPERSVGGGDVKYHLGYSSDREIPTGVTVHLTLSFNPSHLEFVNPVVAGRVRAKQDRRDDGQRKRVMPLVIHGDAAFIGQGVVAETLNLAQLQGYETGGTLHVVINNQVGFTTSPRDSRSSRYCTDITRMLRCPVFHVNGEDPEAVAQVAHLATDYRQRYKRDVVVDLYCYRKYGHNEGDEPRYTHPKMYAAIDAKPTIRDIYIERLVGLGNVTPTHAEEIKTQRRQELEQALEESREGDFDATPKSMQGLWSAYRGGRDADVPEVDTCVPKERLGALMTALCQTPKDLHPLKKVRNLLRLRLQAVSEDTPFDWGSAEWLAYASLLTEGNRVRLTGQDARRGTFSHRHAVLYDSEDGHTYCPLAHLGEHLGEKQGTFEVYDSPLSETGVLGFEYGFSLDSPDALVIWEAQFGDFANSGQVIIDQFISSSEDKWNRLSGLTLLLPHAFEGQGPEHSSARLERFLALCAEDNMQIVNLTTPAQFFHCLRRQVLRPWRKPLVVMTPKSLLRRKLSTIDELATGGFERIIGDKTTAPHKTRRVLMCSGKVYYDLIAAREELNIKDIAIVRFEQLYPLGRDQITAMLGRYRDETDFVWVQEEPWNMGAWFYIHSRLKRLLREPFKLRCVARPESASPATGSPQAHKIEQGLLMDEAFAE